VALKKPNELFEQEKSSPKKSVREDFSDIKKDLDKVDNLRDQIDTVSNSINNSLADVLDKNINSLSEEYNLQIKKFNKKIEEYKKNIDVKVNNLDKSNSDLRADVEILEQRQNKINIKNITEEVLIEVQDVLTGNLEENIKRLEDKIEIIKEAYEQNILNEGLLNEPPETDNEDPLTPLDQNFVTQDDLKQHYTTFLNRIQQQLSTLGGGGAVRIQDMDDVDLSTAKVNDKFLKYNSTSGKWEGADASGGGGSGTKGQKGEAGSDGSNGSKGQKGEVGPGGGDKGQKGEVGPGGGDKGQKGEVGSGSAGAKGQKGEVGNTGSAGSNGSAGAKGQKGEVGSTGSNGSAGSKGQKGEVGSGSAGDKGQKGEAGGGAGSFTRTTANAATSSIANNASANITITAAKTYALQKIQTSAAAWVTLYTDTTSRSNDSSRNEATDPTPGSGVIAEAITTGAATQLVTPGLIGFNNDGTPSTNVYLKVVNKSGSTQAITITIHYLPLET
tara:strand:- start:192 stop:1694 length:1503 start_codon:yes stop_codon:yes gene_type:complete